MTSIPPHDATALLSCQQATSTVDDRCRAAARVLLALDRQFVVDLWAERLLDAENDATAERARRRPREVLGDLRS